MLRTVTMIGKVHVLTFDFTGGMHRSKHVYLKMLLYLLVLI